MEFSQTQRGKRKIKYDGSEYVTPRPVTRNGLKLEYWKCAKAKCSGGISTHSENSEFHSIVKNHVHPSSIQIEAVVENVLEKAQVIILLYFNFPSINFSKFYLFISVM